MAEHPEVATLFQNLTGELSGLSTTLKHHGISNLVESFSGDPKTFEPWIKSIEKYSFLAEIATDKVKYVAYQSSKGTVSDFLNRYLTEHPNCTWEVVKKELATRYDTIVDPQHALVIVQQAQQYISENVQIYAERLLSLANKAYSSAEILLEPVQRQLVGYFITGLLDDRLKLKLIRDNPKTLQEATVSAMTEQNLQARFALRLNQRSTPRFTNNHEPMEIDHLRPIQKCQKCYNYGHRTNECRSIISLPPAINSVQDTKPPFYSSRSNFINKPPFSPNRSNFTHRPPFRRNPHIIWWNCNKQGHISRNCEHNRYVHRPPHPPRFNGSRRHPHLN
ncbi:hypothetical protein SNE40_012661 [Patella caerulea]|uniref:CCHC-type domain-containing protein n=1 Tax=Patella caerulea TaxID=87958 RepID=A0AAN8JQ14_PATCE